MKQYDDAEVIQLLLREGNDYLPDEIIDNGLLVDDYTDVYNIECEGNTITGNCLIECQDESEGLDVAYKSSFMIQLDEDGDVEIIEFTNLELD